MSNEQRQRLEAYLDGALSDAEAAAVSERLRTSPELRSELDRVRRSDALIRGALSAPAAPSRRMRRGPLLALAAAFGVAMLGVFASLTPPSGTTHPEALPTPVASAPPSRVRVVMTLPPPRRASEEARTTVATDAARTTRTDPPPLDDMLATGDVEGALALIRGASEDRREAISREMLRTFNSAQTLEAIFEELEPREQVDLCRAWVEDERFRHVTFVRLRRLADNPDSTIEAEAVNVARDLARRPEFRPWLLSHGFGDVI